MPNPRNSSQTGYSSVELLGAPETVNSVAVTTLLTDSNGDILMCTGLTVPTDASAGFAKGCTFVKTNAAAGTGGNYLNKGTNASSTFSLVTQA